MEKDWRTTIKVMILVTFGTMLFSFGVNSFIVPHKLVSGGISGIALMLYYLTGIQIGTLNLILNIPILYAAYTLARSLAFNDYHLRYGCFIVHD